METILNEIFKALLYLFIAGIIYFTGKIAYNNAENGKYKTVLWKGFLWCSGIALVTSLILGYPSCEDMEYDTMGSHCVYYADDGWEPTTTQRFGNFAFIMTILYIPVVIGASKNR